MLPAAFQIVFRWRIMIVVLLTTLCAGAATWLNWKRPTYYVQAEYRLRDVIARSGRTTPVNPNLVFLAIDSDSATLDEDVDLTGLFPLRPHDPEFRRSLNILSQ